MNSSAERPQGVTANAVKALVFMWPSCVSACVNALPRSGVGFTLPACHLFGAKKPSPSTLSPNAIRPFVPFLTNFEKIFWMLAKKYLATVSPFIYRGETPACYQIEICPPLKKYLEIFHPGRTDPELLLRRIAHSAVTIFLPPGCTR